MSWDNPSFHPKELIRNLLEQQAVSVKVTHDRDT